MRRIINKVLYYVMFRRKINPNIGKNVRIEKGIFSNSEKITTGSNVHIGFGALWNALGGIIIGNNVIIGPKSIIWTFNHNFKSERFLPYDEKNILKPVNIESNVWIGVNVSICPGVTLGEGCIIGMGSVVTKDVPPLAIVGGNPAKILTYRDEELYYQLANLKIEESSYLYNKVR